MLPLDRKLFCEVQTRTILSDAWSRHSHKFVYKRRDPIPEKLLRTFGATAALLENVDDQISALDFGATEVVRLPPSVELSRLQGFDVFRAKSGLSMLSRMTYCLFCWNLRRMSRVIGISSGSDLFYNTLVSAWQAYGHIDFKKYGIGEPSQQVRVALFGLDRSRFDWVLPLHARSRIEQILNVYGRK